MDVKEAIIKRKSVRSYLDKPVEEEKLRKILEAGHLAPSACNRQEWRFVIVRDREKKRALCQAAKGQHFVEEADVVIVCCAVVDGYVMTCGQPSYPIDVAIAIDHMSLVAVELGLGTCWIGAFYEDRVKRLLNIPEDVRVVELLTLGYPKDPSPVPKKRLPLEEIVFYEEWPRNYP